jgi:N-acetylmuramic acid 6-phosphate etherase
MALSGSTRLQASTVLMLAIGVCLLPFDNKLLPKDRMAEFIAENSESDFSQLLALTEQESELYRQQEQLIYETDDYGLTVFTDTTERAPTFNLQAFDNQKDPKPTPSICYVMLPSTNSWQDSWKKLFNRDPRPLNWPEIHPKTTLDYLSGFDFSRKALNFRQELTGQVPKVFKIFCLANSIVLQLQGELARLKKAQHGALFEHVQLKMALNMHSTLVMGRLDRFAGNFMTWVHPTNGKLIDRATRYTQLLLESRGCTHFTYDQIVHCLFDQIKKLSVKESVVFKTADALILQNQSPASHEPQ